MERIERLKQFLSEVQLEMQKVVWPSRGETTTVTMVVLGMVFAFSIFLWIVDLILSSLVQVIIG